MSMPMLKKHILHPAIISNVFSKVGKWKNKAKERHNPIVVYVLENSFNISYDLCCLPAVLPMFFQVINSSLYL